MTSKNQLSLKPGEIRLDYLPVDWPLTPLGPNKDPYIAGWQKKPFTVKDIEEEILKGECKAVGLLGGPVYNYPYGLVWVDIDGPTVYQLVEELADQDFAAALPPTLTICSGKEGRERRLYKVARDNQKHFVRNKYNWLASGNKEKLEILWSKHQGVLMGLHPETEGYFTAPDMGFEWVDKLPEVPAWLLNIIIDKNVKQGIPAKETTRTVGNGFVVNTEIGLEREIQNAIEAMWGMPPEAADDYDIWIIVGQTLHSVDDSLLDAWDEWSKQSEKYKEGECHKRWMSFSKGGGRGLGSLIYLAQENGWKQSQEHKVMSTDDQTLELAAEIARRLDDEMYGMSAESKALVYDAVDALTEQATQPKNKRTKKKKESQPRNPSSDEIANIMLQMYKGNLHYSLSHGAFLLYEYKSHGLWSVLTDQEMKATLKDNLEKIKDTTLPNGYSMHLINDLTEQLRISTIFDDWYEGNKHLLFTNGVLDVETKELQPFQKDLYIVQQLPYEYNPYATCEPIIKWLKETQDNNWERTLVLRAWLRAVLMGSADIQKFVEIVGPGKSGKSTYANLAHALVGDENAMISSLEHLEKNRFETANLYKKKLLLFNDVERYGGSVSVLKAITGRDLIRNERKFQAGSQKPFKFNGLVMITANEPIQTTDPTSGLARRRLTIPFDKPFTGNSAEQKTLIDMDDKGRPFGEFAPMLSGLVNWVLDMTEAEMREYLMETTQKVDFFAHHHKEQILKSNQIMDWMSQCVVFDPGVSATVGLAKIVPGTASYSENKRWLYANYCEFCRGSNNNILGRSRFESLLLDVCAHQLGLNVYKERESRSMVVKNIAVRESNTSKYAEYPSIVEVGFNKKEWKQFYGDTLTK